MYAKLIRNHILANLTFTLVILIGAIYYAIMPREQDPSVNYNWIQVLTIWPDAAAEDVERRVTEPLENGIEKVADIKFVNSTSRQGVSSILVRFEDMDAHRFDKRVQDLRREIQSKHGELPSESQQPEIVEVSSANAFPTATLAITGLGDDEILRKTAIDAEKDLERIPGVDRIDAAGETDPEIQILFSPRRLVGLGVSPVDLADTVKAYFRDLAAGQINLSDEKWFVRLVGTSSDPTYIETLPVITAAGELPLRTVADVVTGRDDPTELVRFKGKPAVMLSLFKEEQAHSLELLERVNDYIEDRNSSLREFGIQFVLLEDQTLSTRQAIRVMERNALVGLILVLLMVWLFLGFRAAALTSLGIPFVLAGTFWAVGALGQTLNTTTLLAIIISLGMLVDDAIVVVEAIHQKLREGYDSVTAAIAGVQEVAAPITSAVLTTIAAFLPLILMPGVLGNYMRTVPAVVALALAVSLIEAFWILPCHMVHAHIEPARPSRVNRARARIIGRMRRLYSGMLISVLRVPKRGAVVCAVIFASALTMVAGGMIRMDFFATEFVRLLYVNVEMPPGTRLQKTMDTLQEIERLTVERLKPGEARAVISYAGQRFTETEPVFGDEKGQVLVSLNPAAPGLRTLDELMSDLSDVVKSVAGPVETSFLRRKFGPPTAKPVMVKVVGDDVDQLTAAAAELKSAMAQMPGFHNISDDNTKGRMELRIRLNPDAIVRAGVSPADVVRVVRLYANGEVVASMRHEGERLEVRVKANATALTDTQSFLDHPVGLPDGNEIALGKLLNHSVERTTSNIRHYDFRRAITVEADIDSAQTDTINANATIRDYWNENRARFPNLNIDFSGELDDVKESLDAMLILFLAGLGLIYLILGTQFSSYKQPLMVLVVVPMAFVGVVFGLFVSGNPLSLYALYGIVALAGICANDAIVLISTANRKLAQGHSVARSIISAARRRFVPIIVSSLTTMAGLFSLAAGLAGESLMWGPLATSILWGLGFSTALTLFLIPMMYLSFAKTKAA